MQIAHIILQSIELVAVTCNNCGDSRYKVGNIFGKGRSIHCYDGLNYCRTKMFTVVDLRYTCFQDGIMQMKKF